MPQQIRTVAVVGCGVIGMSWAMLFLAKGLRVIISDPAKGAEDAFKRYIHEAWPSLQGNKSLEQTLVENYEFVVDATPRLSEADFIQENGPERTEFKQQLMETLDKHARSGVVIASSSSGLPSSAFIGGCKRDASRVLIGHPFNPPHLIPLVEVVPHPGTSSNSISAAMEFYTSLGKNPILIHHEVPGFVANRLQAAINSEAYSLISRGIVSAEDLDAAVTSGPGLRWAIAGPIVTNALGGGGRRDGFMSRLERLGPSIRSWEQDMAKHRFDWSEESVSVLKSEACKWLEAVDWSELVHQRDSVLLHLLAAKSGTSSID
ncbi:3-hydroxyacyl-CoA dehyrogenase [Macrophomina phaseolina]|uniref:3-hydroxyacyl-CoA dehyrogenase n=1 Tax=Macrophomina phaseolina TaxID=35725 RepID=A0ABQ8FV42_9PEZI|nr:3-hydroxyacyl-CoA dehyrogenase [Macrophomina phaseolina]